MNRVRSVLLCHRLLIFSSLAVTTLFFLASEGICQESKSDHRTHTKKDDSTLSQQLSELQTKVAQLEATLNQNHQSTVTAAQGTMKRGSMQGGMMTSMEKMDGGMMGGQMGRKPGMSAMPSGTSMGGGKSMSTMGGMSGMKMMQGKGMSMMGQMQGMGQMQIPSALPGFAGASHIYHIGATSFFLDHPQHISLTQDQQIKLNQVKESTLLAQATFDRWISQGEQELWVLTGLDAPSVDAIETKIREIEKLRSDKRVAYIRAVGEAARILTIEQRQTLVGTLLPSHDAKRTDNQR